MDKNWEYNETVHQSFIDSRTAYDSARKELLNYILVEFGALTELIRLVKL
jgi:hypothetical protein